METRQLLTWYCRVVELGSFSAAAREFDLVPSSLSRAIQQMEEELGSVLLARSTRRVIPTEAGQLYHRHARAMLESMDAARNALSDLQDEPSGRLRLTTTMGFGHRIISPLLPLFSARFPRVEFDLLYTNEVLDFDLERLDLAIRTSMHWPDVPQRVEQLMRYSSSMMASPEYLARHGTPQHPCELADHIVITGSGMHEEKYWHFADGDRSIEVKLGRYHSANTPEAELALAEGGLGIVRGGPHVLSDGLAKGRLVRVLEQFEPAGQIGLYALYSPRALAAKTAAFLEFLRTHLPNLMPAAQPQPQAQPAALARP